jgi:WD40 repeat protein
VAFSSDGSTLASGSFDNTIKLWDVKTGKELQTLTGHSYSVTSVAFSSDGSTLASGSDDETIKLWDVNTGKELHTLTGHSYSATSVAFSSDGSTVASGSDDETIKLWDVKTGKELHTLTGHSYSVNSVALPSDGSTLASRSSDHTIEGHPIPSLQWHYDPRQSPLDPKVTISNNWIFIAGEKLILLPPEYHQYNCSAVKGATIALGYRDGRLLVIGFHAP